MKPILFNAGMVQAILDGCKTVTRRLVKPQPTGAYCVVGYNEETNEFEFMFGNGGEGGVFIDWSECVKAPCWPGETLYVRETWKRVCANEDRYENGGIVSSEELFGYRYRADDSVVWDERPPRNDEYFLPEITEELVWHPSIHMPKSAARIFLRVTNVRVEKLREITSADAYAEGLRYNGESTQAEVLNRFRTLWDSTIKPADLDLYGWDANPWVWVIEFECCKKLE